MATSLHDIDRVPNTYTEAEIKTILKTVRWRSDVALNEIAQRMDRAALECKTSRSPTARKVAKAELSPSKLERQLNALLGPLRAATKAWRRLPPSGREAMFTAAEDLAEADGEMPSVRPWAVRALDSLGWFAQSAEMAVKRIARRKAPHGHPVPDRALYAAIRSLNGVYFDFAADPHQPGTLHHADNRRWRKGELLDFLEAALPPLGVQMTREAIYSTWQRATIQLPTPRRSETRATLARPHKGPDPDDADDMVPPRRIRRQGAPRRPTRGGHP